MQSNFYRYQERYLACRKIFFCDEFAFFQCREALYRDDIVYKNSLRPVDLNYLREAAGAISPGDYFSPTAAFRAAVRTYSTRQLRYASDTLYAFDGILQYFSQILGSEMSCGLPRAMFALSLCWKLSPPSKSPIGRRAGFPSWSWCGWTCPVRIPHISDDLQDPFLWTTFEVYDAARESEELRGLDPVHVKSTTDSASLPSHTDLTIPHLWCLTFDTAIGNLMLGAPHRKIYDSSDVPDLLGYRIYDCNGTECGRIQLLSTWASAVNTTQEFVILKDSTYAAEYRSEVNRATCMKYNEPSENDAELEPQVLQNTNVQMVERPYYIVFMTVQHTGSFKNARERAGLGYIYKRAIYRFVQPPFVWQRIVMT